MSEGYRISHHSPRPDSGAPMHDVEAVMPGYYRRPRDYQFHGGGAEDRSASLVIMRAHGKPDAVVTIYRAVPAGVTAINPGDWVTTVRPYAETHAFDLEGPGKDGVVISAKARAADLYTSGDSHLEWGWWPGLESNPRPPEKPLRIVFQDWGRSVFAEGLIGRKVVGRIVVDPIGWNDAGQEVAKALGGLPGWVVSNVELRADEYKKKGYGTQLYLTAFAEAVRRTGGPIVVGASADMLGWVRTSSDAARVWERLRQDYPSHPSYMALRFGPEDIEPWMLPRTSK